MGVGGLNADKKKQMEVGRLTTIRCRLLSLVFIRCRKGRKTGNALPWREQDARRSKKKKQVAIKIGRVEEWL
jgi:hypothetical protein